MIAAEGVSAGRVKEVAAYDSVVEEGKLGAGGTGRDGGARGFTNRGRSGSWVELVVAMPPQAVGRRRAVVTS